MESIRPDVDALVLDLWKMPIHAARLRGASKWRLPHRKPRCLHRSLHQSLARAASREHSQDVKGDSAWFLCETTPKLDVFTLAEITEATGLNPSACSPFRAGTRVPHATHRDALVALIEE